MASNLLPSRPTSAKAAPGLRLFRGSTSISSASTSFWFADLPPIYASIDDYRSKQGKHLNHLKHDKIEGVVLPDTGGSGASLVSNSAGGGD